MANEKNVEQAIDAATQAVMVESNKLDELAAGKAAGDPIGLNNLMDVPVRVTVGDRGLKEGKVELTVRRGLKTEAVPLDGAFQAVTDTLQAC